MAVPLQAPNLIRFGPYVADLRGGELRKCGLRVKLQDRPFEILAMLLERQGQVVTRQEMRARLWPDDTFVDFDNNISVAVRKLRDALGDTAGAPHYIETVGRRGYRFIVPVETVAGPPASLLPAATPAKTAETDATGIIPITALPKGRRWKGLGLAGLVAAFVLFAGVSVWLARYGRVARRSPETTGNPIRSLAVLPLKNLSNDPSEDYFAEGMTDELITRLATVEGVRVISRTSVMHYKDSRESLPEIARELNVDAVVEGSVERSGERVRIRTQLIHASTDQHLWAASYDRQVRDVLRIQSDAARDIVREIRITLTPDQEQRLARVRSVNPEVYDLYLKGRYFWNKRTKESFEAAIEYFNAALEKDRDYALAYVGLADCYNLSGSMEGRAAAEKALQLDDSLAEAHASLAYAKQKYDWDFAGAEREFKRAIELNPNYSTAHQWYAAFLTSMGRNEEASAEAKRALDLDPFSVNVDTAVGVVYYFARQFNRATEQFRKAIELDPNSYSSHVRLAQVHLQNGMYSGYLKESRIAAVLSGKKIDIDRVTAMSSAYAHSGSRAMFLKEIKLLTSSQRKIEGGIADASPDLPAASPADRYLLVQAYAQVGDKDRAFECLDRGYRARGFEMFALKNDPQLDSLRSDPRFAELVRKVGLPPD